MPVCTSDQVQVLCSDAVPGTPALHLRATAASSGVAGGHAKSQAATRTVACARHTTRQNAMKADARQSPHCPPPQLLVAEQSAARCEHTSAVALDSRQGAGRGRGRSRSLEVVYAVERGHVEPGLGG